MSIKADTEKKITIVVKEFYPEDNSLHKITKVNQDTYDYLCKDKINSESRARKDRRYLAGFAFDEVQAGERDGIYSSSPEEEFFREDEYEILHRAIKMLSEYEQMLIMVYYFEGKKLLEAETKLGIPKSTLSRHLAKARKNLKEKFLKLMKD